MFTVGSSGNPTLGRLEVATHLMTAALTHVPKRHRKTRHRRRLGSDAVSMVAGPSSASTSGGSLDSAGSASLAAPSTSGHHTQRTTMAKGGHPSFTQLIDSGAVEAKWNDDAMPQNARLNCAEALWKYVISGVDIPDVVRIQLAPLLKTLQVGPVRVSSGTASASSCGASSVGIDGIIAEGEEEDGSSGSSDSSYSDSDTACSDEDDEVRQSDGEVITQGTARLPVGTARSATGSVTSRSTASASAARVSISQRKRSDAPTDLYPRDTTVGDLLQNIHYSYPHHPKHRSVVVSASRRHCSIRHRVVLLRAAIAVCLRRLLRTVCLWHAGGACCERSAQAGGEECSRGRRVQQPSAVVVRRDNRQQREQSVGERGHQSRGPARCCRERADAHGTEF
jgi:hypothetical protein